MPSIRQLPPSVINKIAAGEVIERPASVVKELLENSVDAGATRIDLTVAQGGTELIRIADNGCGVIPEELKLAVASHATSKIRDADDLFHVATLGFRGEALASIAEISQFVMRSRTHDRNEGFELEVNAGQIGEPVPCGCPPGTTVEVRNLFCNTPVRRKFLRTTQTEMSHITEAFTRIALPQPHIHFTLRHNQRTLYDLPPVPSWRDRLVSFFGDEIDAALIPIESRDVGVQLSGYAADPHLSRGNTRMQYFFLNGRHIRDKALTHALGEAYRGLLMVGRSPLAFLQFQMSPELVDVNVHPSKLEVRFQEGGRIYSQLLGALRKQFLATDMTARARVAGQGSPDFVPFGQNPGDATHGHDSAAAEAQRRELVDWAKGQLPAADGAGSQQSEMDLQYGDSGLQLTPLTGEWRRPVDPAAGAPAQGTGAGEPSSGAEPAAGSNGIPSFPPAWRASALQIHNRYLVVENNEGVVVIDQHALHERILYEQLRRRILSGSLETQRLLVPEPVSLTSDEAAAVIEAQDALRQVGLEVEPFGGDTVLVSGYPAMLSRLRPAEMLRQVIDELMSGARKPDPRTLVNDLLNMMACKAAVKAGDRLTPEEIEALLEQRDLCQDAHHCPHGRPTSLVFTREQLDRMFKRT
ncbi:DNA mismatch repair endonuclease MutL [Lignipirellula cremea]|uniref:DNA mismatch repair protein MutL n=1 Tax=Lignipirellula cremea TaxID=2528010 RepID=A0A518DTR7_9BACT|nr:DNA mismatch repair endonuclease MutL [Lignipirellula cremea]QDU95230.1 DNA mismatch repair protein MutL [Lignipirellula cremea]